jgi:hypothetical protein
VSIPRNIRINPLAVFMVLPLVLGNDCDSTNWQWPPEQQKPVKPAARPIASPTGAEPVSEKAAATARGPRVTVSPGGYYQLVLLSQPAPSKAPARFNYLRIQNTSAENVGRLLSVLFVPAGPAPSENRYILVYPTELEWKAAAQWARLLDVPETDTGESETSGDYRRMVAFAIGLLHATPPTHPEADARERMAAEILARVMNAQDASAGYRWLSGMVAGYLLSENFYNYTRADQCFVAAESVTPVGSYERMVAMYHRAHAYSEAGQEDLARDVLRRIVADYSAFARAEVFDRARKTLAEAEAQR